MKIIDEKETQKQINKHKTNKDKKEEQERVRAK